MDNHIRYDHLSPFLSIRFGISDAVSDRSGTYPVPSMPYRFGLEGSGVVVALPSDPSVLQNEDFVKRGFKIGSKVVFVRKLSFNGRVCHSNEYTLDRGWRIL